MARIEDTIIEHDDFDTSYSNASSLPDGRGKMAANFISMYDSLIKKKTCCVKFTNFSKN